MSTRQKPLYGTTGLILHPFFFALYCILSLFASNIGVVDASQLIRPTVLALIVAFILLLAIRTKVKDWAAAGMYCLIGLVFLFFYGHVYTVALSISYLLLSRIFEGLSGNALAFWIHPFLLAAWGTAIYFAVRWVTRWRGRSHSATLVLNLVTLALLLIPILQILGIGSLIRPRGLSPVTDQLPQQDLTHSQEGRPKPDVYFIVLDGYTRSDVLQETFNFDNAPFIDLLRGLGFYIAEDSRSNYAQTLLSVASALNMDYLPNLVEDFDPTIRDVDWLIPLSRQSQVRQMFEDHGYQIISFSSGYAGTELKDVDLYMKPPVKSTATLESLLIRTSALLVAEDLSSAIGAPFPYSGFASHRQRMLYTLEQLPLVAEIPGPKFVFAHILAPHPPFVFDQFGEAIPQRHKFALRDASDFEGTPAEYIQGYRDQLMWINSELERILPLILAKSTSPPIIILQGDHGSGTYLSWDSPQEAAMGERMSILNAYHLPGISEDALYRSISPVNSFRLVSREYFGYDLSLLPDQSYFSSTDHPFRFTQLP